MAVKLVGRGQFTLVSLHDGKTMQVHLDSNMPSTQFYSRSKDTYTPNYRVTPIVITPELYFGGSQANQIGCVVRSSWTINGVDPKEYGGAVDTGFPYALIISDNLQNAYQLEVKYVGVVQDPDTKLETTVTASLCFTKKEEANPTPTIVLSYPCGSIFKNNDFPSLSAVCKVMAGGEDVSQSAKFVWSEFIGTDFVPIVDSVQMSGQGTDTITVLQTKVQGELQLRCEVNYGGSVYTDFVTFATQTDPLICKIENKNGDKMRNGQGLIYCEAHVYQGDNLISDIEAEKRFQFKWIKYNKFTGEQNTSWVPRLTRKIELSRADVDKLSTFICEVKEKSTGFDYKFPIVLS